MAKNKLNYFDFFDPKIRKLNSVGMCETHSYHSRSGVFINYAVLALVWDAFAWFVFRRDGSQDMALKIVGVLFLGVAVFLTFFAVKSLFRLLMVGDNYL